MFSSTKPRITLILFISFTLFLLILSFAYSDLVGQSFNYADRKAQDFWESTIKKSSPKVYNCQDPYRRPGYLHIEPDEYKQTAWIPYTDDFLDADVPSFAEYPTPEGTDTFFNATGPDSALLESSSTPQQWMHKLVAEDKRRRSAVKTVRNQQTVEDFVSMKDDDMSWLWGRRVLMLGDSVDRFMMQYFCEELGRGMKQARPHTTATCTIPTFNLTLVHWHLAGSFTHRPTWWWMKDMKDIAFEDRWDKLWSPMLNTTVRGPNGRPDLLLWQSVLWDQRALWEAGQAHYSQDHPLAQKERKLVWQEIRLVAARLKKLVKSLHAEFGSQVPVMYRAGTIHRNSNASDASIYELDRVSRAIAEQAGHEVFEWGRIMSSLSMLYKDHTHPGKGAGSWLWGNMILEYLARSAGRGDEVRSPYFDGWQACHDELVNWGGR